MALTVRRVGAQDTVGLRQLVLRDGRAVALPDDDKPAHHLAAYHGDLLVGTGNVRPEEASWAAGPGGWRLRGMATAPSHRCLGVGGLVLGGLVEHCRAEGGAVLWCHARVRAQRFYERGGFMAYGEAFDTEHGPHVKMLLLLDRGPGEATVGT